MIDFDEPPVRRPYEAVVPLINIVFLLLIFFLLAGTLKPADTANVELPTGEVSDNGRTDQAVLFIEADGFVWVGDKVMDASLAAYSLRDFFEEKGTDIVTIKADANAPAHELLALMEGLRNVGVTEVTLVTERGE